MDEELAPDLSTQDREDLEVAGMSPRAIDDAIAALRLRGASPFTVQDVLALGPLRKDEIPDPP
jgi:hypothetical protein